MPPAEKLPGAGSPYRDGGAIPPVEPPPRDVTVRWSTLLVVALGASVLWIAGVAWREHRLTAAVAALPGDVQRETFVHIRDELLHVCTPERSDRGGLDDRCRAEAAFLLRFPQCDADCARLALPLLTGDARK